MPWSVHAPETARNGARLPIGSRGARAQPSAPRSRTAPGARAPRGAVGSSSVDADGYERPGERGAATAEATMSRKYGTVKATTAASRGGVGGGARGDEHDDDEEAEEDEPRDADADADPVDRLHAGVARGAVGRRPVRVVHA